MRARRGAGASATRTDRMKHAGQGQLWGRALATSKRWAGELGFEPRVADPKSAALPLGHSPSTADDRTGPSAARRPGAKPNRCDTRKVTENTPRSRKKAPAPAEHHEGRVEHAIEAIHDRVRDLEMGLLEGDHTPIGELSGLFEETVHPDFDEDASQPTTKGKANPGPKPKR